MEGTFSFLKSHGNQNIRRPNLLPSGWAVLYSYPTLLSAGELKEQSRSVFLEIRPPIKLDEVGEGMVDAGGDPVVERPFRPDTPAHVVKKRCHSPMTQPVTARYRAGGIVKGMKMDVFILRRGPGGQPGWRSLVEQDRPDASAGGRQRVSGIGQPHQHPFPFEQATVFRQIEGIKTPLVETDERNAAQISRIEGPKIIAHKRPETVTLAIDLNLQSRNVTAGYDQLRCGRRSLPASGEQQQGRQQ